MENTNIALSDAERNKELFEYEMTEVILQLKGEFANVSGKDLQLDESRFETPTLNVQSDILPVNIQPVTIEAKSVEISVSDETFVIPEIVLENRTIDCPAVSAPVIAMPSQVSIEQPVLDCKTVDKIETYSATEAKIELPVISVVVPAVSIGSIPEITVSETKIPNTKTDIKLPTAEIVADIEMIRIDIPNVHINLRDIDINVDIPTPYNITLPVDADIKSISMDYSPILVEVKPSSVDDVTLPKITRYIGQEVSLKNMDAHVPKTPEIFEYNGKCIKISASEIELPVLPKVSTVTIPTVTVEPSSTKVDDVLILDLTMLTNKEVSIKVEKTTINFEYPTAEIVQIPAVIFRSNINIDVPAMPDFASEIQDIIDSAV